MTEILKQILKQDVNVHRSAVTVLFNDNKSQQDKKISVFTQFTSFLERNYLPAMTTTKKTEQNDTFRQREDVSLQQF